MPSPKRLASSAATGMSIRGSGIVARVCSGSARPQAVASRCAGSRSITAPSSSPKSTICHTIHSSSRNIGRRAIAP
ncbi:hypothetical protein [Phycisphaera mikurensis]|uniref:hypothetical protein n=1 Tax=Phycisphaera mikurensis TaxID=547188 RepID=UPI0012B5EB3E|nr:hypothetical protein [Phycisphaera mikurensis]